MASFTIASGTTVTSTFLYAADSFTLTNLGVVTVASEIGVSLPGMGDVLLNQGAITGANFGVYIGAGGNITNILKFCCTEALSRGSTEITGDDLSNGIRRELAKENRTA